MLIGDGIAGSEWFWRCVCVCGRTGSNFRTGFRTFGGNESECVCVRVSMYAGCWADGGRGGGGGRGKGGDGQCVVCGGGVEVKEYAMKGYLC